MNLFLAFAIENIFTKWKIVAYVLFNHLIHMFHYYMYSIKFHKNRCEINCYYFLMELLVVGIILLRYAAFFVLQQ